MNVNIGKNTLGDSGKMSLSLKEYGRSTSNLSYAWRSTMGVGSLVPFMKIVGLPGDTFEIEMDSKILTNPTIGPLFGSLKFQADLFTCPIRLYNAMLHNNALNVGLDMKKVKMPKIQIRAKKDKTNPDENIARSSLLAFLGKRKIYGAYPQKINGTAFLAYYDIFKNYYANKQEKKFPMYSGVMIQEQGFTATGRVIQKTEPGTNTARPYLEITVSGKSWTQIKKESGVIGVYDEKGVLYIPKDGTSMKWDPNVSGTTDFVRYFGSNNTGLKISNVFDGPVEIKGEGNVNNKVRSTDSVTANFESGESIRKIELYNLEEIDDLREYILSKGKQEVIFDGESKIPFIAASLNEATFGEELGGLCVKTHLSDIYNNWVNNEWVSGDNGVSRLTSINTSGGSFTIDTLNLAKKVYEMLNRIAISGGSYKDWIETVYTTDYYFRAETPVYEGGMSSEIEFEPIVSNSASNIDGYEPLGTLAGRGINTNKKGGKIIIKINEPCYIMGIASITPRVDYGDGEDWDNYLDTLDDLHKPQLDGIGFQDLLTREVMSSKYGVKEAIGKQPAWIQYTTAVNKTYADFAKGGSMAYMVLNKTGNMQSSYITPEGYNNIFAATGNQERNFQVQIGCGIKARRVKSAREIPTF